MAYDLTLAGQVRDAFARTLGITEKKMFGGVCFLLYGNLCVGVWKESLIVRLSINEGEAALYEPHVRPFDVTGRPMRGWVMVDPDGLSTDADVQEWASRAAQFVMTLPPK
jgi:hypothetical protein